MCSNELTLLPAASPAPPFRPRVSVVAEPMIAGCGPSSPGYFAEYDPASCSWRTSQPSFMTTTPSERYSATFPRSGSMRTGRLYQRAPWVHHTHGTGCSLWPTPREMMSRVKVHYTREREGYGLNLEEVVYRRGATSDGYLNPRWIEWLMGFPIGWCELPSAPSATP